MLKLLRYSLKAKRAWDATYEARRAVHLTRKTAKAIRDTHDLVTQPGPVEAVLDFLNEHVDD